MSELDKLEKYLKDNNIRYDRIDEMGRYGRHQINVLDDCDNILWDAICHRGSYGFEEGLLEIYGDIVNDDDNDSVVGWLTAEDVIKRIKASEDKKHE